MEPYKAKKLPIEYIQNRELINLLAEAEETYGEYKGYLKNMSYEYSSFLECAFVSDLYYSFKIDGAKIDKEYMFHAPYMIKNNDYIEFNNMKKALLIGVSDSMNSITVDTFHKINKTLFLNCKKNNLTKGSGKFRKSQNYILKPGIAGSSVSFIPPVYTEITPLMNNLIEYINNKEEHPIISSTITHYQYEKIHPYISGNGKIGRLIFPIQIASSKKEPPILFISEVLDKFKNTYFTLLSGEVEDDINKFIKFILQSIIEQCNLNIKKIKKLNKIYNKDIEEFKHTIGGTTIDKVYPFIIKKVVFTTNDIVSECKLHINSVNKVLNKLVDQGYLIKEKKKGTNRVTFCYKSFYDVFMS
jgi:Fic family protein